MKSVGIYDAKTHLSALLDEVAEGQTIIITRHGTPVAELRPANPTRQRPTADVIAQIRALRQNGPRLDGAKIRDLIEEGRK